ncbi:MAG: hypothetical protein H6Q73_171 [Firmicutes bacterium]|nr:hypothetical protein [Bacillota bacterium]
MDGTAATAKHYQAAEVQPIEIMQMHMTKEEFCGFCKGNIIKYVLRCGKKDDPTQEIAKAKQYAEWLFIAQTGGKIDPWG